MAKLKSYMRVWGLGTKLLMGGASFFCEENWRLGLSCYWVLFQVIDQSNFIAFCAAGCEQAFTRLLNINPTVP